MVVAHPGTQICTAQDPPPGLHRPAPFPFSTTPAFFGRPPATSLSTLHHLACCIYRIITRPRCRAVGHTYSLQVVQALRGLRPSYAGDPRYSTCSVARYLCGWHRSRGQGGLTFLLFLLSYLFRALCSHQSAFLVLALYLSLFAFSTIVCLSSCPVCNSPYPSSLLSFLFPLPSSLSLSRHFVCTMVLCDWLYAGVEWCQ